MKRRTIMRPALLLALVLLALPATARAQGEAPELWSPEDGAVVVDGAMFSFGFQEQGWIRVQYGTDPAFGEESVVCDSGWYMSGYYIQSTWSLPGQIGYSEVNCSLGPGPYVWRAVYGGLWSGEPDEEAPWSEPRSFTLAGPPVGEDEVNAALASVEVEPDETQVYAFTDTAGTAYEIVRESGSDGSYAARGARAAAAVDCWLGTFKIKATSVGSHQFTWRHYVHWCENGTRVTSYISNLSQNLYTGIFWNWRGPGGWVEDIRGTTWRAGRQGVYELCYGPVCPQRMYPRHLGSYRANGKWKTIEWSKAG